MEHIKCSVFLSHSHRDNQFTQDLHTALQDRRTKLILDIWLDRVNMMAGDVWRSTIIEAIRTRDIFMVAVPEQQHPSIQVALECGMAMALGKPIIPIARRLEDVRAHGLDHLNVFFIDRYTQFKSFRLADCAELARDLKSDITRILEAQRLIQSE
jgi:hypothetical protein